MPETSRTVVISRRRFALRARQVERRLRGVLPEPLKDHFVVINRRRYPPKQVLELVTGLDRAEFTTHHARRILTGLGFPAGRRTRVPSAGDVASVRRGSATPNSAPPTRSRQRTTRRRPTAQTLEPFVGQWVATKGAEVLVAAPDPQDVVAWLAEHGQLADSMFRVASDQFEASGIAPL